MTCTLSSGYLGNLFTLCCSASELVDWLVSSGEADDRIQAVELGQVGWA